jgi:RimJ/RimL family protein N-acetyltransferase
MTATRANIPDLTLETLCRSFCREATGYGFTQIDYVKFVNLLLDTSMQNGFGMAKSNAQSEPDPSPRTVDAATLPLQGARVAIRQFDAEHDLPLFDRWLSDSAGRYFLLSRTTSERLDIREVVHSETTVLGIVTLPDSTPIGSVAFLDYDPVQCKAELRKLIGDAEQRRKGYAKEASALWIRYGFEGLGLKKIYLNTLETDIRNVRLNEELGFMVEGVLRNEVLIDGTYRDVLRMGLWHTMPK